MTNELENARARVDARSKAALEYEQWNQEVDRQHQDKVQRDFEALMPHLESLEQSAWEKYVPRRLMDVFGEVRSAIEDRERIRLDEAKAFIYGQSATYGSLFQTPRSTDYSFNAKDRYLLRRMVATYSSGEQEVEWAPAAPYVEFLNIWKGDQVKFLRVRTVAFRYGDLRNQRQPIMVGFTVPVIGRPTRSLHWYAGDGMYAKEDTDRNGWIELREGVSDLVTDEVIDELAERMAVVVDQGLYIIARSPAREDTSRRSQTPSPGGSYRAGGSLDATEDLGQPHSHQQRILDEHRRREAELEDQRDFLVGRMIADPDNPRWRELLEKVDPMLTPDDIAARLYRERQDPHYYSQDEIAARTYRDREYPPPGPGDHASGADRG